MLQLFRKTVPAAPATPIHFGEPKGRYLEVDKWALSSWLPYLTGIIGTHPYPIDEIMLMCAAFWHCRPEVVIDIGTHHGKSARVWYELVQASKLPTAIHTIDICDPAHVEFRGSGLGKFIRGLNVKQHIGDGCLVARQLLTESQGKRVLLFIDGDHRFETVQKELELLALLGRGAALLHDTFYQPGSTYNHGPYEAIQDYLVRVPAFQVLHMNLGLPGMTYIAVTDPRGS